jgi:hypothetical protein
MGDYEGSTTVDVPRDDLFDYLSRVENLPKYLPRMTEAHSLTGDQVSVEAELPPRDAGHQDGIDGDTAGTDAADGAVHGEAEFHVDADQRRMEWSAVGPHDYHGELSVDPDVDDDSRSHVTVRLHTLHDDVDGIELGLAETLENIERLTPADVR